MPSKTQADVNLWFLYICLQKSDYKTIDFNAVGEATSLNPPAARMRFSRLKKAIETSTSNFTAFPERTSQSINIEGKSTQQCKSHQAKSKGTIVKKEEQMQHSGYRIDNPTMTYSEMGVESDMMIYNQQGPGLECASSAYEANSGDTEDDDIPLATKRKAARCSETNKKRQKQINASHPTGIKNEWAIADENIGLLSHKVAKRQFHSYNAEAHGLNYMVKNDDVMVLDDIPSADDKGEIPYTHQYSSTTNMTLVPPATTTTLQDMVPEYISPFTNNNNNNQFASRLSQQRDLSYDPYWSSWPSTVSQMTHPRDHSAAQSLSAHASSYIRSPGIGQNSSATPWTTYRIPNITITDTDPFGVRNPLYPGSTNAVDKVQIAMNETLFSPGSKAFDRSYAGTEMNDVPRD
ncbi:hypothetical protein GX50_03980 [[Emmonsia] crescens]|uniref:Myb-like DNA-binding domain-containing protein n=1 Tax=[Emmonsia] crescens TaxID=73230 RepID=A0A2B7ZJ73_9EURO|nr:hypothetical protein GX50_03980 [Emmonsia crescens]